MMWWFLILAVSGGAVVCVGIAFYFRVRHHMKKESPAETEHEPGTSQP